MKMIRCLLGDIITFQRGYDLPRTKMVPGSIPVVGSNGIIGYHNQHTTEAPCITIGRSGNVGNPKILYERAWAHNTTLFVKEFKNVDPVFVYYLLLTLDLGHYSGGSAVPTLNRNHIHSLPITIPAEIEIQKRIARILSSLDDKIEVNNQINRNLEEQLLLMYIANCEKTNSSKDSLSKFCSFQEGYVNPPQSRSDFFDGPIKWLRAVDINESYIISTTRTLSEKGFLSAGKSALLFPPDSIAITKSGTIGRLGLIANEMCGNRAVINIVPLNPKWLGYIYCYLKSHQTEFSDLAVGSVQKNLYVSVLAQLEIESPEEKVWTSFHCFANNILRKIKNNCLESFHLSQLRDILLPKLMSGEMNLS